jgi:hypothetical protein
MHFLDNIDAHSVKTAIALLKSQNFVPLSPADRDESGRICLCAAGLLASAGLRVNLSSQRALRFDTALAETRDKNLIYNAFAELGWGASLCRDMVERNDTSLPEHRTKVVGSLLETLSSAI